MKIQTIRKINPLVFLFVFLLGLCVHAEEVTVKRVIDGDTFQAKNDQDEFLVRLLYVNTPESVHRDKKQNHPMGKVASDWLVKKLEGKVVNLVNPPKADSIDYFQRRLALVYLGNELINLTIIAEGLSPYFTKYGKAIEPFHTQFKAAEKDARNALRGIWSDPVLTKKYLRLKSKWGQEKEKKSKSKKKSKP
ncbi:MAG: thermonuclease family protein [bacterium]|nr:thermonuclease family protein [bacterium]